MKTLKIVTTREFPTDAQYEDYKNVMNMSGVDFSQLEKTGKTTLSTHQQGESVVTEFELTTEV